MDNGRGRTRVLARSLRVRRGAIRAIRRGRHGRDQAQTLHQTLKLRPQGLAAQLTCETLRLLARRAGAQPRQAVPVAPAGPIGREIRNASMDNGRGRTRVLARDGRNGDGRRRRRRGGGLLRGGRVPMALEPVHFRGRCVPNRREAAIGVRGRFRGKRQDRPSCGRRDGRNGDGRRRRRRGGGLLRGDRIPMALEPSHFRGQRVHFALNRRDAAIGVRGRFRGKRQDRQRCERGDGRRYGRGDGRNGDSRRRRRQGGGRLWGGQVLVTFEPAHFRGQRVAFARDRRDGAIGVGRRFRGGRQDPRSCGRRSGRNGDGRRRRRWFILLRRGPVLVTFEPAHFREQRVHFRGQRVHFAAHFRGQRVHFALDLRYEALGVPFGCRNERGDGRSCGRRSERNGDGRRRDGLVLLEIGAHRRRGLPDL